MDGGGTYKKGGLWSVFKCCTRHSFTLALGECCGVPGILTLMSREGELERKWKIVGWIFAAIALVIVAGPQILALITG